MGIELALSLCRRKEIREPVYRVARMNRITAYIKVGEAQMTSERQCNMSHTLSYFLHNSLPSVSV